MSNDDQTPADPTEERYADRVMNIACAYFGNHQVAVGQIGEVIKAITTALVGDDGDDGAAVPDVMIGVRRSDDPAVPIKKSIGDDFIICLEDGKKMRMLKRYLRSRYDMSSEQYREKWSLPPDYPMTAPAYARLRSEFAKASGLGTVPTSTKATS